MIHRRFRVPLTLLALALTELISKAAVVILVQPLSQTGYLDQNITFTVVAHSLANPLRYQWRKDNVSISNATANTLVVPNVQFTNAGAYTVIVTDGANDSATSAPPAILTIKAPAMSIALNPGVTIEGGVGLTYGIQFTTDLSNTNSWQGLTNVVLTTSPQTWYDPQPAALPRRYYRILRGPIPIP